MRVLDVGCGNGDLSRFIAGLVGPEGEVVGIDRSEQALTMARGQAVDPSSAPIHYRPVDLAAALPDLGHFDAIVGRRVLMYLPDPATTLAHLIMAAKPGAIVAFQEHARADLPYGLSELALHRRIYEWVWSTVAAEGGDVGLGLRLVDLMQGAGLTIEDARSEGVLFQSGEPSFLPTLVRAMLPRLLERGVANADDVGLETLAARIEEERSAGGGTILWDLAFLVSARLS
jgi:SAM-dependent methyltransferase